MLDSLPFLSKNTLMLKSYKLSSISIRGVLTAILVASTSILSLATSTASSSNLRYVNNFENANLVSGKFETNAAKNLTYKQLPWDGLPSSNLTPGAVDLNVSQDNLKKNICAAGYTAKIRPSSSYTSNLKLKQIKNGYAVDGLTDPKLYEEDHLIPLELGGNPSSEDNLWPELYDGTNGAKAKDKLENFLHSAVCKGEIKLVQAQNAISKNWIEAYSYFFGNALVTRYAEIDWKPSSKALVGIEFTGGKDVTCEINKIHSIDSNMYGITDWTFSIKFPDGTLKEGASWNYLDNVNTSVSYANVKPGQYSCLATINGSVGQIAVIEAILTIDSNLNTVFSNKIYQTITGAKLSSLNISTTVKSKPVKYKNCSTLNSVYPGGVALPGAVNKGGGVSLKPTFDRQVYSMNTNLDRDKDGIACEK